MEAPTPALTLRYAFCTLGRLLTLSLGEFGASTLEAEAERCSVSPAELGRRAVGYYLSDRGSGRMALRVPQLPQEPGRRPAVKLSLDLDRDTWRELDEEAESQQVSVERLLEHAIVYFLADLDAGRVEWGMLD
jgi:hypothetical protein